MQSEKLAVREISANKFTDPDITAKGEVRAWVDPVALETLWINTGSICNLTCENCYIESSPTNDRLSWISLNDVRTLLDEIEAEKFQTGEIGFTGGEPFLNRDMLPILQLCLARGYQVLVLTNAMNTLLRQKAALEKLGNEFGDQLQLRISLDHYSEALHAKERGARSWKPAIKSLQWLSASAFAFSIAGRTFWGEAESSMRQGYQALFERENISLDAFDPHALVLFPEMDLSVDVPEITTACWGILDKNPAAMMCATSRMVVKHKGDDQLSVMACTLLPYDQRFNLGATLRQAWQPVKLNHPHCAKFCVLGGGSCSS